jgi:hypothetical protein
MQGILRRVLAPAAVGLAVCALGTGTALASGRGGGFGDGGFGLIGTSHQLNVLGQRIWQLGASGDTSTTGVLETLADCGYGASSQLFANWGDPASYSLAPGGDLATSGGWTLRNASIATAHDPYSAAAGSLVLSGDNAVAETPVTCVDLQNPTLRFFLSHAGPRTRSTLEVYVVYQALNGRQHTLTLAELTADGGWQPSPVIAIGVNALATVSANGWTPVAFGFQAHSLAPGESYSVDGIYVDPCLSR